MFCQNCGQKLKASLKICPNCGYENSQRKKINFVKITSILFLVILIGGLVYGYTNKKLRINTFYYLGISKKTYCEYQIFDLKEYRFPIDYKKFADLDKKLQESINNWDIYDGFNWEASSIRRSKYELIKDESTIYYEGYIRNTSNFPQKLINLNAKLKTQDNIFIKENWSDRYETTLAPGDAIAIKFNIYVDEQKNSEKYLKNPEVKLKTEVYPWFENCEY